MDYLCHGSLLKSEFCMSLRSKLKNTLLFSRSQGIRFLNNNYISSWLTNFSSPINQCLSNLKYFMRDEVRTIINSQLRIYITTMGRRMFLYQKTKTLKLVARSLFGQLRLNNYLCSDYSDRTYEFCLVRVFWIEANYSSSTVQTLC